jgi:molybdate/tungstate transport system substrate-binding protein
MRNCDTGDLMEGRNSLNSFAGKALRSVGLGLIIAIATISDARAVPTPIRVAYAGSMGAVMDQKIGPAFAAPHDAQYQGIGQASYALAHLLESKQMQADVFVPVTPGPVRILIKAGLVKQAIPIASTQMVVTYSPSSKFAPDFEAVKQGKKAWYEVLQEPGLRFGRTDPATDPQGRNIIFTFLLAQDFYHVADLSQKILGPLRNESQIFAEPSLLTRLEGGQIDASVGYLSAIKSQHLPYIELPHEINLSDAAYFATFYSKVSFATTGPDGKPITAKPEPLVFYAAVLTNAEHPEAAAQFVDFLRGAQAQGLLRDSGYDAATGGKLE